MLGLVKERAAKKRTGVRGGRLSDVAEKQRKKKKRKKKG